MEYTLEPLTIGLRATVPLSEDEYRGIQSAKSSLALALSLEEKFDLVVENYLELEESLVATGIRHMVIAGWDYRQVQVERGLFNRRLVNLLTAARTYIDHAPQHMNDLRAAGCCDEAYSIAAHFSEQYDSRLGYRAMSALRNYVQHCGFPLHVFKYNAAWADRPDGLLFKHTIELYLSPDQLEADGKFKASVLDELKASGERADLMRLARDYIEGLWVVHHAARSAIREEVSRRETVLAETINRFAQAVGEDVKYVGATVRESGSIVERIQVFMDSIEYRKYLERKNVSLANLPRRYVTTEPPVEA